MLIEFLTPDDLTEQERQSFRDQNIDMDHWNYMLIVPTNVLQKVTAENQDYYVGDWYPMDKFWLLSNLLPATYENKWFNNILFREKMVGVGIVYH